MRILFVVEVIVVCYFGYRSLREFDNKIENFYSNPTLRETKQTRFMMLVLVICAIASASVNFFGRLYFVDNNHLLIIPSIIFGCLLFGMGYMGSRQDFSFDNMESDLKPSVRLLPINNEATNTSTIAIAEEVLTEEIDKKSEEKINEGIASAIERLMSEDKMYLIADLKLGDVTARLNIGRTTLSNYINKSLQTSFSDFINRYRVSHACELMKAHYQKHDITLMQISEISGFANENTFYRVFRKHTGHSPKKWIEIYEKDSIRQ